MEISLGYDKVEDRIWLRSGPDNAFWLTRRLLAQLLPPAAKLLESSTPGAEMPMAPPAHERIRMDHAEALAELPDAPPPLQRNKPGAAPKAGDPPRKLVDTLKISHTPPRWEIVLSVKGEPFVITLDRIAYHRFLAALHLTVQEAGWGLSGVPAWMADPRSAPGG